MRQTLFVITDRWHSVEGELYCGDDSFSPMPLVVGVKGMCRGTEKQEGDKKTPAGCFALGPLFSSIDDSLYCVDDPESAFYNQFVRQEKGPWKSAEKMLRDDGLYRLGAVIGYNLPPAAAYKGSCIFLHIWKGPHEGTLGCTAMAEADLARVLSWLDMAKEPTIVQFPREAFEEFKVFCPPELIQRARLG